MPFNYKTELHRYRRYYQSIEGLAGKPKARAYTTAIFSFLAVSLFGWYAIRPTLQTILYLRKEIEDTQRVNQQMEEKIGKLIEAHTAYQRVQDDLPSLKEALPDAPEALTAIGQIRNIAIIRGASISAIASSQTPLLPKSQTVPNAQEGRAREISNRKVNTVQMSVVLLGTYETLKEGIEDILGMRRLVTLETMGLTVDRTAQPQGAFEALPIKLVVRLQAYYVDIQ